MATLGLQLFLAFNFIFFASFTASGSCRKFVITSFFMIEHKEQKTIMRHSYTILYGSIAHHTM